MSKMAKKILGSRGESARLNWRAYPYVENMGVKRGIASPRGKKAPLMCGIFILCPSRKVRK